LYRPSQLGLTASGSENVRAFVHKFLRGGKANAAIATSHKGNFAVELTHTFLLMSRFSRSVSGWTLDNAAILEATLRTTPVLCPAAAARGRIPPYRPVRGCRDKPRWRSPRLRQFHLSPGQCRA